MPVHICPLCGKPTPHTQNSYLITVEDAAVKDAGPLIKGRLCQECFSELYKRKTSQNKPYCVLKDMDICSNCGFDFDGHEFEHCPGCGAEVVEA